MVEKDGRWERVDECIISVPSRCNIAYSDGFYTIIAAIGSSKPATTFNVLHGVYDPALSDLPVKYAGTSQRNIDLQIHIIVLHTQAIAAKRNVETRCLRQRAWESRTAESRELAFRIAPKTAVRAEVLALVGSAIQRMLAFHALCLA